MATIHDVARRANVSVATVSRYINQNGYVGKKSKEAIERAIKELNFVPNNVARTLSTKKSNLIGLIIPDIKNPFFPELARAVEDTAYRFGYTVILCNSDEDPLKEKHYLKVLTQEYVAGIIITSTDEGISRETDIPIVALDRAPKTDIPSVTTNNKLGAELAGRFMLECGASELLILKGPNQLTSSEERLEGFLKAVEGKNIKIHVVDSPYELHDAENITYEFLQKHPSVDGIFGSSDVSAIGALKACEKLGKKVPDELQIIGFDGIQLGNYTTPSLTTVAQKIYQLGETATELLINEIEGKSLEEKNILINPELVVRETTRKEFKQ
ncbi:MAG: LacI family DNA-binding transcriptional regulator [Bacilli bacterium]|jgi:LacI family transcriptional regulator|uniref:LacI family DNA-binding transcriptional regulator n=1 Tax=Ureibacillus suwonensis TaxID=313007 RepID=A0ABW0R7T1_9BACL